jgi:hypothetical protein
MRVRKGEEKKKRLGLYRSHLFAIDLYRKRLIESACHDTDKKLSSFSPPLKIELSNYLMLETFPSILQMTELELCYWAHISTDKLKCSSS